MSFSYDGSGSEGSLKCFFFNRINDKECHTLTQIAVPGKFRIFVMNMILERL